MTCFKRPHVFTVSVLTLASALLATSATAGPVVVPTAEGQIGETPGATDQLLGPNNFESIRGQRGDVVFGNLLITGGVMPPPPEVQFLTDMIHGYPDPVPIGSTPALFTNIEKTPPDSGWSRNAADDGDFVAFSFAVDGAMPDTITVRVATFDETGSSMVQVPIVQDVPTFTAILDPRFTKTGVAVDNQGRATVAYTELSMAGLPRVKATRADATAGTILDFDFLINDNIRGNPDVALLDPAGNRLIIGSESLAAGTGIKANIVDLTGATPMVMPEFQVNDTAAPLAAINPAVASDPETGVFTVVWDHLTGAPGDPADVRARRFDAMGNPIAGDFRVNSLTANAQGQPAVAYGLNGLSAIVWAGDPPAPGPNDLDVFLQVYDSMGNPIGGEVTVNTFTDNTQDRPAVRFLPERDAQGRPQVAVAWRDVGNSSGANPRGTGVSYKCFSINGFDEQVPVFADGFESGDTTSWSDSQP